MPTSATGRRHGMLTAYFGTTLEFYDFFIFGAAAATVFPELFFPALGKTGGLVLTMVAYGVGYVDRPLGAFLFRRFGRGRTDTWLLTAATLIVGVSTTAIGLLPTYQAAGAVGGVLLIVLRAIQGVGLGGEWGRATLAMADHTDDSHRGLRASLVQLGSPSGLLAGNALLAVAAAVAPGDEYLRWGWRVPFAVSGVLIVVLLMVRLRSLRLTRPMADRTEVGMLAFCRLHWRQLLIAIGVRTGSDVAFYVLALYVLGYVTRHLGLPRSVGFTAVIVGAIAEIVGIVVFGVLAEHVRRKWIVASGAAASAAWVFAFFTLLDTRVHLLIYVATAVGAFLNAAMWSPARVFIPELFPPGLRYAGTGLGFQLAAVLGGGVAPLVSVLLVARFGSGMSVAVYVAAMLVLSAVAACLARTVVTAPGGQVWKVRM